tara:strand:+ start:66 stop:212 length:147 start_codon:yes stop_codon:yes gene_type:complete
MKRKPILCDKCETTVYLSHEEGVFVGDNFYCMNCAEELEATAILSQEN